MTKNIATTKEFSYVKHMEVMALLVIGAWVLWGVAGVQFFKEIICSSSEACAAYGQVGDIFGGINAFFAALGFVGLAISIENTRRSTEEERRRNRDRELLEQVLKSYGWAYEAFIKDNDRGTVIANRLNWLVTARHLLRAKKLADQISSSTYRTIQQENEEHWRTQFYRQVDSASLLRPGYYFEWHDERRPLDHRAAIVIADFVAWKEDVGDPIDDIEPHELMLKPGFNASSLGIGIKLFIDQHIPSFAAEHADRIERGKPPEKKK